jgi:hypothetical protein
MKSMLHSSQLQFSRDGRSLSVVEEGGVTLIQLRDGGRQSLPIAEVQAVAAFAFPDKGIRAELGRAHLPRELPRAEEPAFDALARKYQLSGGYLRDACLRVRP